jgi:hypothetical protein
MASPIILSARRGLGGLACVLGLAVVGCSGHSGGPIGPSQDPQDPPVHQPPPPVEHPPPPNQPPGDDQGITGVYVLSKINDSDAGQTVTISNPDGNVIGLYRFDPASELEVDALGNYTLRLRYKDEKGEYALPDQGTVKWPGGNPDILNLTFESNTWGDSFTGMAAIGVISIQYDFDGDGRLDTVFGFTRVGEVGG